MHLLKLNIDYVCYIRFYLDWCDSYTSIWYISLGRNIWWIILGFCPLGYCHQQVLGCQSSHNGQRGLLRNYERWGCIGGVMEWVYKILKGDLRTICRFSYMKVYKLITLGTKFKTLLSLGRKITMFSKFITNYIEQGWWHSSLTLKCMHLLLKEVNKRGRHAYNLHGWTCLPSGIVMEIHCHITGIFEAAVRLRLPSCCSV